MLLRVFAGELGGDDLEGGRDQTGASNDEVSGAHQSLIIE